MILVVTSNLAAEECAATLREAVNEEIVVAGGLQQAVELLRTESYLAVVLDQFLVETEPQDTATILRQIGTAIPLQMNLAISGPARVAREVRVAVQRRHREVEAARRAALGDLHSELNGTVTALLLCCEMALREPGLPSAAAHNIESVHQLVRKLQSQMEAPLAETRPAHPPAALVRELET